MLPGSVLMGYETDREFHGPSTLFLFSFDLNDLAAFVMPAIRANTVRQAHLSAIGANYQVVALQRIVCAPAVATTR